jgi:hypothetical protein
MNIYDEPNEGEERRQRKGETLKNAKDHLNKNNYTQKIYLKS